jgi:hypothetical protein
MGGSILNLLYVCLSTGGAALCTPTGGAILRFLVVLCYIYSNCFAALHLPVVLYYADWWCCASLTCGDVLYFTYWWCFTTNTEAEFLGVTGTKVLSVFLLAIHSH